MTDGMTLPLIRPLVDGPSAWKGVDLRQQPEKWIYRLSKDEIAEIEAATDAAMATGKAMADITKEDFVLPSFAKRLSAILDGLFDGCGFIVIRGFPTDSHPILRNAITFWGICRNMGNLVSQNTRGHLLGHVRDVGLLTTSTVNARA